MIYRANIKGKKGEIESLAPQMQETKINPVILENKKEEKIQKKKGSTKKILFFIFLFLFVFIAIFAFDRISSYRSRVSITDGSGNGDTVCDNILNPSCWTEAFRPNLKQQNGYTSALVIGVDTRRGTSSLLNTDSIMQIVFKHDTQEVMMISIPRDFWSTAYNTKINAVYAFTYKKGQNEKNDPYFYLKEEVTKITGIPIQYDALIKLDGVVELVDKIGGVEICVNKSFTAQYPNDDIRINKGPKWYYIEFPSGCQTLDGYKALVYSRFRMISKGPSYLASDFSRGARQQEVVDSIKNKILSDNVPVEQKAETYWGLFQSLGDTVEIGITIEDMLAALYYINTFDKIPMKVVLDPNFGGLNRIIKTESISGLYAIRPVDRSYKGIQSELGKIWASSAFYKETPTIVVRNQTGDKSLSNDHIAIKLRSGTNFYKNFTVFNDAKSETLFGIKIFDFSAGTKPRSLEFIKNYLGVDTVEEFPEKYGIKRSDKNEDILIVVGPIEPTPTTESTGTVSPTE